MNPLADPFVVFVLSLTALIGFGTLYILKNGVMPERKRNAPAERNAGIAMDGFADRFREPGQTILSPQRIGQALGWNEQDLAERAGTHNGIASPDAQADDVQRYLRAVVRVLSAATDAAGGDHNRVSFWFLNEPLRDCDFRTADDLVCRGRSQAVIDHLTSRMEGATGRSDVWATTRPATGS